MQSLDGRTGERVLHGGGFPDTGNASRIDAEESVLVDFAELKTANGVVMAGENRREKAYKRLIWAGENAGTFSAFSRESSKENTWDRALGVDDGSLEEGSTALAEADGWAEGSADSVDWTGLEGLDAESEECEDGSAEG